MNAPVTTKPCVYHAHSSRLAAALFFAVLSLSIFPPGEVLAQSSGYATRTLDRYKGQNSTSAYSTRAIVNRNLARSVPQVGILGVNRQSYLTSGSSRPAKPFSGINRSPSVSPYLALDNSLNPATDYYNIVRPQQQQRQRNAQLQRNILANQRRIGQIASTSPYNPRGDASSAPTGHFAVYQSLSNFLTTGNYYPPPTRPKSRR